MMCNNYEEKLLHITGNYQLVSIYHHAKNVGIIGILAYPKIFLIMHQTSKTLQDK